MLQRFNDPALSLIRGITYMDRTCIRCGQQFRCLEIERRISDVLCVHCVTSTMFGDGIIVDVPHVPSLSRKPRQERTNNGSSRNDD